jgi:hypothetical protein
MIGWPTIIEEEIQMIAKGRVSGDLIGGMFLQSFFLPAVYMR